MGFLSRIFVTHKITHGIFVEWDVHTLEYVVTNGLFLKEFKTQLWKGMSGPFGDNDMAHFRGGNKQAGNSEFPPLSCFHALHCHHKR